ncbi:hypothetical protein SAMN04487967_2747 [Natronorubrum sediminis]|uniref:Uncharacterized protein n=1 Tax=Natronorubrum sediminis TaxID=640943 RepID=A0A1H6G414_9EURY|nr:hypothetical protein [Natronorubrum sediminis]SEH16625.1 hypothetical protein SAMN04487967_2747 [Natronorubrum sediminis]
MKRTELRRRDLLVAVSGGCVALAGCSELSATRAGYGAAYGNEYGAD